MTTRRVLAVALPLGAALAGCGSGTHGLTHRPVKEPGRAVTRVKTTPASSVYVPDVADLSPAKASAALNAAGLAPAIVKQSSSSTPAGLVIGTNPSANAFVASGQAVRLLVSSGPAKARMPNVIAEPRAVAELELTRAGLVVVVTEQPSKARPGYVLGESPSAGGSLVRGSTVRITVAAAEPAVTIPGLIKQTEEAAVTTASRLGLTIVLTTRPVHLLDLDRIVLGQSPLGGTSAVKGAQLTLTVGAYRPPRAHAG